MSDLEKKLIDDIKKTGFPAELSAASKLRSRKWSVEGNTYFIDKDEQKGREIDLYARYVQLSHEKKPEIQVVSVIYAEIKKTEKPWVIFSSEKSKIEKILTGGLVFTHNVKAVDVKEPFQSRNPAFKYPRYGRSGYVSFVNNTAVIFSAIVGVAKATIEAHGSAKEIEGVYSDVSLDAIFFSPVVILEGDLYECYLDSEGKLSLNNADYIPFRFHYASPNYESKEYHVDIVKLSYFEEYLIKHENGVELVFRKLHSKVAK